jgi:hypothetical protein
MSHERGLSHFCSGLFRFDILSQKPQFFGEIQRESGFLELWETQGGESWSGKVAEGGALALGEPSEEPKTSPWR